MTTSPVKPPLHKMAVKTLVTLWLLAVMALSLLIGGEDLIGRWTNTFGKDIHKLSLHLTDLVREEAARKPPVP